jgi:hypothetical protein
VSALRLALVRLLAKAGVVSDRLRAFHGGSRISPSSRW